MTTTATLISGPPRTGKTIFAHALKARLVKEGQRVLVLDGDVIATFKEEYASEKWDHIILTTNARLDPDDVMGRRITTLVRTQQV
jgi:adenylylsulfate kinase-like enzyme